MTGYEGEEVKVLRERLSQASSGSCGRWMGGVGMGPWRLKIVRGQASMTAV